MANQYSKLSDNDRKQLFWNKVNIKSENDCWEWKASLFPCGYGQHKTNKKNWYAHRYAMFITKEFSLELHVLHKCDNPLCVNPKHLFLGTHQDNMKDRNVKGRQASGDKIRNSMPSVSGSNNPMYRRNHSEKTKLQISLRKRGLL